MRHRAVIERDMAVGEDDWGQSGTPDWRIHLHDLPCAAWFEAGREVIDGAKTAVIEDRKVIVPLDTDVTEKDRVARITDRRGKETIFEGPARIESVGRRRDHLALMLEAV
jgi:hypothetical protein